MARTTTPLVLLALSTAAACGGKGSSSTLGNTSGGGKVACPAADRVRIATWTSGASNYEGQPRWRLPLVVKFLEGNWETHEAQRTPAVPATTDDLRAAGAEALPPTVWLYRETLGGPAGPCAATVGAPYRAVGGDGATYQELGVELDGCGDPNQEEPFYGWISLDEPTDCSLVLVAEAGARTWDGEHWDGKIAEGDPMPKELTPHVPAPPTPSPGGIRGSLWAARAARTAETASPIAWELTTTYIDAMPGTQSCSLDHIDDHLDHFVMAGGAAVPVATPAPARLTGVLSTAGSPRVLLFIASGDYTTVGVDATGKTTSNGGATYYIPHEEDGFYYSLAPYCGP
jgi:hypothetical protein